MIDERNNILAQSNAEIVRGLGEQFRDYRLNAKLTQQDVADKVGVSLITIRNFETGKAKNITLSNLLSLLRVVGRLEAVNELFPPIPLSPYMLSELNVNKPKRVRHAK
jgi:transcriptional regulator with XRE-family HTH domain